MRRRRALAAGLVAVALVVAVNALAARSTAQVDLSASRRFSLTTETRDLVKAVVRPLRITAFIYERGGAARDARFLLDRYRELNDRIDYRLIDPDEKPAEAKRYAVSSYSTVVVEYDGRRADAPEVSEVQVSSAILRAMRGDRQRLCAITGHGEPRFDDDGPGGLSTLAQLLDDNGFEVGTIDLTGGGAVPEGCRAVLLLGPAVALAPAEVSALQAYAAKQGRLLVLGNSGLDSDADLNPLLEPWGISISQAIVLDPQRSVQQDPFGLVVQRFPTTNPIVRAVPSLQLTLATGLLAQSDESKGLTVSTLATTSDAGYLDADQSLTKTAADIRGPILVAAAADASRVSGPSTIERTRVVAVGNSHFATNEFIDDLGNRRFLLSALLWLTEQEQLLTVGAAPPQPRQLPWTNERQATVVAVAVIGVPGAVLGVGAAQWLVAKRGRERGRRRRRQDRRR